jgi:hypothetical protein
MAFLELGAQAFRCNKFVISTGGVMGLRPTQGDEKRLLSEAILPWKRRPHLCHLDRSEPGFPATRHRTRPRVRLSLRKGA